MTQSQLDFAFLADLPTLDLPSPKRKRSKASAAQPTRTDAAARPDALAALPSAAAVPADSELEHLAQRLAAHPDYRVLRRLQPRLHWPEPAAPWRTATVLLLDTETTGLDAGKEQIIELALLRVAVDTASGLPVGAVQVYDGLQDPGRPIPPEVVALTGIRDADVRGQQLDEARVAALMQGVDVVIAHNAGFDRPFVEKRLPGFAQLAWACSFADIDWKARGRSSSKLENLALALGLFYDAHRAEMDCHALLAVLAMPLADGPVRTGLAHLIAAVGTPRYRLSATQAPFEAKDTLKARGYRWNAEQRVWATRLDGDAALQAEYAWLRAQVYGVRQATVQVEVLDALTQYSGRSGRLLQHSI